VEFKTGLVTEGKGYKNKDLDTPVVAACALIAHANGEVSADEKKMLVSCRSTTR
jgi:tellurite resistance protein